MPDRGLVDSNNDSLAGNETPASQERCPPIRIRRDVGERASVDDAVLVDKGQCRPEGVGGQGLDDVAGEVEALRNLPDPVAGRSLGYLFSAEKPCHRSR